jgi:hypothetical protein
MRTATIKRAAPVGRPEGGRDPALVQLTERRLGELQRLIGIGLAKAERLAVVSHNLPPERELALLVGRNGSIAEYVRVGRAVRQLIALEFELNGLFAAPDRDAPPKAKVLPFTRDPAERAPVGQDKLDALDDLKDRSDYDAGPLDQVIAGIRKTLGADTPKDDPFAAPAERKSSPSQAAPRRAEPRANDEARRPRKAAMAAKPSSAKAPAPAMQNAARPAEPVAGQPVRALNRHQRRKAERRMRRNRGPPK